MRVPSLTKKHLHPFEIQEMINLRKAGVAVKVLAIDFEISERQISEIMKDYKNEIRVAR